MTRATKIQATEKELTVTIRLTAERFRPTMHQDDRDDYEAFEAQQSATEITEELPKPGTGVAMMVASSTYVGPNGKKDDRFRVMKDNGEGWPGNSDHNIKKYNGWRGTSDDWAFYGEGLRTLDSINVTGDRSKKIVIRFGNNQGQD